MFPHHYRKFILDLSLFLIESKCCLHLGIFIEVMNQIAIFLLEKLIIITNIKSSQAYGVYVVHHDTLINAYSKFLGQLTIAANIEWTSFLSVKFKTLNLNSSDNAKIKSRSKKRLDSLQCFSTLDFVLKKLIRNTKQILAEHQSLMKYNTSSAQ